MRAGGARGRGVGGGPVGGGGPFAGFCLRMGFNMAQLDVFVANFDSPFLGDWEGKHQPRLKLQLREGDISTRDLYFPLCGGGTKN